MSNNVLIGARIKVLEEKLSKSGNTLGKDAGLGNKTVDGWRKKPIDFSTNSLEIFLNFYKINKDWWMTGKGSVFLEPDVKSHTNETEPPNYVMEFISTINKLIDKHNGEVAHLRDNENWFKAEYSKMKEENIALANLKDEQAKTLSDYRQNLEECREKLKVRQSS